MGVLIFCATPSDNFTIWMWIYICRVLDVQSPNVLIVESLYPMIFSAIAPPDRSECAPIMLVSIPISCSLRIFAEVISAQTMSLIVTYVHTLLIQTSHIILSSVPLFLSMWYTLCDRSAEAPFLPVDSWCKVLPILPFLLI